MKYISKCSKLGQEDYKNGYDWVKKVISNELDKRLNFENSVCVSLKTRKE